MQKFAVQVENKLAHAPSTLLADLIVMKLLTVLIGCFLIVLSYQMQFGSTAPTDVEDEDPVKDEESVKEEEPFHEISKQSSSSAVTEYIEAMQGARNYHFTHYRCRLRSIFLRAQEKVHMMAVSSSIKQSLNVKRVIIKFIFTVGNPM